MSEEQLNTARQALNRGDQAAAADILEEVISADDRNAEAWYLMAQALDGDEEKQICLENVLTIEPDHSRARAELDALTGAPSLEEDLFAAAAEDLDAAFAPSDDAFDAPDDAFDVGPDINIDGEINSRLDRLAANRRLLTLLLVIFGLGFAITVIVSLLILAT